MEKSIPPSARSSRARRTPCAAAARAGPPAWPCWNRAAASPVPSSWWEGGPDYLAALHFAIELDAMNVLPVAILGRNAGRAALDPRALHLLRGRRVRLFPHADADGGGLG